MKIDKKKLSGLVKSFSDLDVCVYGDIMLDHFIRGKVERISPEAPVPVVRAQQETFLPGGAGNVAANLASLGAQVNLIAVAGADYAGDTLLSSLKERRINISSIVIDQERPTTQKVRVIAEHQQVVRYDRESSKSLPHALSEQCAANLRACLKNSSAVILSDYKKGMITPGNIKRLVGECKRAKTPVFVDPKVEHFKIYKGVTSITPNTSEAWNGMSLYPKDGQDAIEELGRKILAKLGSDSALVTQGPNGMTLFEKGNPPRSMHIPVTACEVYDVTGAGDTVISVLTLAYAAGATLREAAVLSNYAAGLVVGKLGTATVTREELIAALP
ncbi:MAG: D-glycero-beta-D-manno-heptose-7-phosphate kinase [Elusimicrobia bacterium]|nr:D-glycero-beta-D-manno-heptose-7-phosphate kinase [Elusimicrobiota bacterium]